MKVTDLDPAFHDASIAYCHNARADEGGAWPAELDAVLGRSDAQTAFAEITRWPGYAATPLRALERLAKALGVAQIHYKDEAPRFGLGSFKALGGAYAVAYLLRQQLSQRTGKEVGFDAVRKASHAELAAGITVATATDGNHGRSVAWGAQTFGCPCRIYIHAQVSEGRKAAMEAFGAEVVRIDGNYDESVRQAAADAERNGWFIVSDTSYEGYVELPRQVMAGYTVMVDEVLNANAAGAPYTHVFVQGGVGGLAAAVCARLWQRLGEQRPRVAVAEPDRAPCLYQSAVNGAPTAVPVTEETIMAGLSCGEVSALAWQVLDRGAHDFITVPDDLVGPAMSGLARGVFSQTPIVAGESAVAGLAALAAVVEQGALVEALGLDGESRVLVLGTEGATDPGIYTSLTGLDAHAVGVR